LALVLLEEQVVPAAVRETLPTEVRAKVTIMLAERAVDLGWPAGSVLVVGEDTAMSARWAHARIGFRELAAEVGLGHAGVILALEVSRLAEQRS